MWFVSLIIALLIIMLIAGVCLILAAKLVPDAWVWVLTDTGSRESH